MIRLYMLSVSLLFVCATSLHGMAPEVAIPDNSIMAIGRDVLRGGLIVPGLVAAGFSALSDARVIKDINMGVVTGYTLCVIVMGFWLVGIPICCRLLGVIHDVEQRDAMDYARKVRNLFRCCYGALALYCMFNAPDIIRYGLER